MKKELTLNDQITKANELIEEIKEEIEANPASFFEDGHSPEEIKKLIDITFYSMSKSVRNSVRKDIAGVIDRTPTLIQEGLLRLAAEELFKVMHGVKKLT